MRKKKQEINFIDWSGKVVGAAGILGMAAYIAGYFKFFFLYKALNNSWVLGLHSIQDVIVNGAIDVTMCAITAIPLFFGFKSSLDIDNHGRRIVGYILSGVVSAVGVGVLLLGYKLDVYVTDLLTYGACYLMFGVFIANAAKYAAEEGSYQYLLLIFIGFILATAFSSYLVHQYKTFRSVYDAGGYPYSLVAGSNVEGTLISSVNGKYLIRLCGATDRYQLVIPTERWVVEESGHSQCGAEPLSVKSQTKSD